jgi:hypothetical protein
MNKRKMRNNMGRIKDIVTDLEINMDVVDMNSPIQYVVIDEDEIDLDEVNFELQMAADEARDKE